MTGSKLLMKRAEAEGDEARRCSSDSKRRDRHYLAAVVYQVGATLCEAIETASARAEELASGDQS